MSHARWLGDRGRCGCTCRVHHRPAPRRFAARGLWLALLVALGLPTGLGVLTGRALPTARGDEALRRAAVDALRKAVAFQREKVARHGGYVYFTTADLKRRWGEGECGPDTIFVQPPGTPSVGTAFLQAHAATGDASHLDAARDAALALVHGQLRSGGWTQTIHFGPPETAGKHRVGLYRKRPGGSWNASSLDDDQTQAALRFLALVDRTLDFRHAEIHEAATFGFDALLKAQFANGGFPQVWREPAPPRPALPARYPEYDWKTEGRVKNYWDHYTLNDNLAGSVCATLLAGHAVYREEKYLAALRKLGDFLILAQMPEPQPGWCQQYNFEMVPIWARKFEPPAIAGAESQDAIETLLTIARVTGDKKYLAPVPRALEYFQKHCVSKDGKIPRFHELKTNKPLYMDQEYRLTHDDSNPPSHYGWKQTARFDRLAREYERARGLTGPEPHEFRALASPSDPKKREAAARQAIAALDSQGRWVGVVGGERVSGLPPLETGEKYLSSEVFRRNVAVLAEYIAAATE